MSKDGPDAKSYGMDATDTSGPKLDGLIISTDDPCAHLTPEQVAKLGGDSNLYLGGLQGQSCKIVLPLQCDPAEKEQAEGEVGQLMEKFNIKVNGTLFTLANDEGIDVQQGKFFIDAVQGGCEVSPDFTVKALGFSIKPGSPIAQTRGEILDFEHFTGDPEAFIKDNFLEIYAYDGSTEVMINIETGETIVLEEGEEVVLDQQQQSIHSLIRNTLGEVMEFDTTEAEASLDGIDASAYGDLVASTVQRNDGGCNAGLGSASPLATGPLMSIVVLLFMRQIVRAKRAIQETLTPKIGKPRRKRLRIPKEFGRHKRRKKKHS